MTAHKFAQYMRGLGACDEGRLWAKGKTDLEAWEQCTRPSWLYWWLTESTWTSRTSNITGDFEDARIKPWIKRFRQDDDSVREELGYWFGSDVNDSEACNSIRAHFKCPTLTVL